MSYDALKTFLTSKMRMSHVYQPVMLRRLLLNGGRASRTENASDILNRDPTQLEYYEQIVRDMVGRVLTSRREMVIREGEIYELAGAAEPHPDELNELIAICDAKIAAYEDRRGGDTWEHRRRSRRPLSGTVRYEVLKRAHYRCELCGISAEIKALEVDHILPRNHGGSDDISNFQALCFTCKASKRDRDSTDFRGNAAMYRQRQPACLFCDVDPSDIIAENQLAFVRSDKYPVTPGHLLVIPKRHTPDYFELTQAEINAISQLLRMQKQTAVAADASVAGFNVGVNVGEAAGQTIMHCHVHLIPRRARDVENPQGGIRHVVAGKGDYLRGD